MDDKALEPQVESRLGTVIRRSNQIVGKYLAAPHQVAALKAIAAQLVAAPPARREVALTELAACLGEQLAGPTRKQEMAAAIAGLFTAHLRSEMATIGRVRIESQPSAAEPSIVKKLLRLTDPRLVAEALAAQVVDLPDEELEQSLDSVSRAFAQELVSQSRTQVSAADIAARVASMAREHLQLLRAIAA